MDAFPRSRTTHLPTAWPAARLTFVGLRACAVVGVLRALPAGAKVEHRILVVRYDSPDMPVLWWLSGLVAAVMPLADS